MLATSCAVDDGPGPDAVDEPSPLTSAGLSVCLSVLVAQARVV